MSAAAVILGILFAILKLRTSAISWGQEPSGHQNTDYPLVVHDRDWQPAEVPVKYATQDNGDQFFRYLGVQIDDRKQSKKQFNMLRDRLTLIASTARHKLASPDTIIAMAIKLSTHRKIFFLGKLSPWSLKEMRKLDTPLNGLYKAHLKLLPSAPNATLYTGKEVGGMGIMRLSDQIIIDKWAMMVRGLYSDNDTSMATQGILQRSLQIGQTDTNVGFEAIAKPTNIPQHL